METPIKGFNHVQYVSKMSLDDEFLQFTPRTTLQAMKEAYRKNDMKEVFGFDIKRRNMSTNIQTMFNC